MWRPWSDSRQRTSVSVSSANQSIRSPIEKIPALLIQPPRLVDVPTSGETVTTRSATSGASRARSTKKRPKACWVDSLPRCPRPRSGGTRGGSTAKNGGLHPLEPAGGRGAQLGGRAARGERRPRIVRVGAELLGERLVLSLVEQRGVVRRMALGRQRPALDGVREDDAGTVVDGVGVAVAVEQRAEVVAAQVAEGSQQLGVVEVARVDLEALAQLVRGRSQ